MRSNTLCEVFPPVEVFKTNVIDELDANQLVEALERHFPDVTANFALDDCDKVLRIKGSDIDAEKVISLLRSRGFKADLLE